MTGINSRYLHLVIAATITGHWHLHLTDAPSCFWDVPGIKHQSLICLQLTGHVARPSRRSKGGRRDVRKMKISSNWLSHTHTCSQASKAQTGFIGNSLYAGCVIFSSATSFILYIGNVIFFDFQHNNGLSASLAQINLACIEYVYFSNICIWLGTSPSLSSRL